MPPPAARQIIREEIVFTGGIVDPFRDCIHLAPPRPLHTLNDVAIRWSALPIDVVDWATDGLLMLASGRGLGATGP